MNDVMLKDLVDYRALQYGVEALQEVSLCRELRNALCINYKYDLYNQASYQLYI